MNFSQGQFVFEETGLEVGEKVISVGEYIRTLNTVLRPVEAVVQGEVSDSDSGNERFKKAATPNNLTYY